MPKFKPTSTDTTGSSSHTKNTRAEIETPDDICIVKTRVKKIIEDLLKNIAMIDTPTISALNDSRVIGRLMMKKFLCAACDDGIPTFEGVAKRASAFFIGLTSLDMDQSPYFQTIQGLGNKLIETEAVQTYHIQLPHRSKVVTVDNLKTQSEGAAIKLKEMEDLRCLLQDERDALTMDWT